MTLRDRTTIADKVRAYKAVLEGFRPETDWMLNNPAVVTAMDVSFLQGAESVIALIVNDRVPIGDIARQVDRAFGELDSAVNRELSAAERGRN